MNTEIWKPIAGFVDFYEVSNLGRVRSLDRKKHGGKGNFYTLPGRVMSLQSDKDGYQTLVLRADGAQKNAKVHRLVASAFIRPGLAEEDINHIDGDVRNNLPGNLEWCDRQYNVIDAVRRLGRLWSYGVVRPVIASDGGGQGLWFPAVSRVTELGFSRKAVHMCLSGQQKKHKNLAWGYA